MNGAESLVRTLIDSEIDLCFTNPGTSEMHFVAALDKLPGMRCVLGLFEGVVTGAADGFYRLADRPAATLLHLGPGLANGLANLHNAKKAGSGIVNIVGEHATFHLRHDAPLTADIEAVAAPMSHWVRTSASAQSVASDGAQAVEAARAAPGRIATLILPADTAWNEANGPARARAAAPRSTVSNEAVRAAAMALRQPGAKALLLGGLGVRDEALLWAGRIAAKTGCLLLGEYNSPRAQRGAGRVALQRVPYVVDSALALLKDLRHDGARRREAAGRVLRLSGQAQPAGAEACAFTALAEVDEDIVAALEALADELGARGLPPAQVAERRPRRFRTGRSRSTAWRRCWPR